MSTASWRCDRCSKDKRTTYNAGHVGQPPTTAPFWGYYGYGWGSDVHFPGSVERDAEYVVVETTIYSVPRNQLLWAAVSETQEPEDPAALRRRPR